MSEALGNSNRHGQCYPSSMPGSATWDLDASRSMQMSRADGSRPSCLVKGFVDSLKRPMLRFIPLGAVAKW